MTWLGAVLAVCVLAALTAIAVSDAKRMTIPPVLVLGLIVGGLAWVVVGGGLKMAGTSPWEHAFGLVAGFGVPLAIILGAKAVGRRWPIYPGDGMLMGAVGVVVGVRLLFWSVAIGSMLAIVHRICIQVRRGRPIGAGYLPAGPGLAAGAAIVFVAVNSGVAFSAGKTGAGAEGQTRVVATELVVTSRSLPSELAGRSVDLQEGGPLPFKTLLARIGEAAGVGVAIEERPARIAGGAAELPEPPALAVDTGKALQTVLDDVARIAGYSWEWKDETIVFYRYWDTGWAAPAEVAGMVSEELVTGGDGGLFGWLRRVLGGGDAGGEAYQEPLAGVEEAYQEPSDRVEDASAVAVAEGDAGEVADVVVGSAADVAGGASGSGEAGQGLAGEGVPGEQAIAGAEVKPEGEVGREWHVDPEGQKTVRGVLEDWALQADWKVAWRARHDFSVGAPATFQGKFLEAVDLLLSDPRLSRVLVVRAHSNRYLVVESAGG